MYRSPQRRRWPAGMPCSPLTRAGLPEAPAELGLDHFAHRVARQRVHDLELLGDLLDHDLAADHESPHRVEGQARRSTRSRHDASAYALATVAIRHADHCDIGDLRMLVQL